MSWFDAFREQPPAFADRAAAGAQLAARLATYGGRDDVRVLALPRGGVPVAFAVATALHAPLDVFLVRKLGVPGREELAMGAIATGGVRVLNADVVREYSIPDATIAAVAAAEGRELARRERLYRDDRPPLAVRGCAAILVDDGLATGATMRAAVVAVRGLAPARVVVAVPVAPPDTCTALREEADEVICLVTPEPLGGVGRWYGDFAQTSDDEVRTLLMRAAQREIEPSATGHTPCRTTPP